MICISHFAVACTEQTENKMTIATTVAAGADGIDPVL